MTDTPPCPADHIGLDLVRAARNWEMEFTARMIAAGHPWFAEARGRILQHIPRTGIAQSAIVSRTGLSKQAIQQHLDTLEAAGVLRREPSATDQRQRQVILTKTGLSAMDDAHRIKLEIDALLGERLGVGRLARLKRLLSRAADFVQDT